jgi:hypothetical protein
MLPDFRFVIGATLAAAVLGIAAFGLATTVRLSHLAKIGPMEVARSLAFDERANWNQFSDPELTRRFEDLARQADATGSMPEADAAGAAPQPTVASPSPEAAERNEPSAAAEPADAAPVQEQTARAEPESASTSQASTAAAELQQPAVSAALAPEPAPPQQPVATDSLTTAAVTPPTAATAKAPARATAALKQRPAVAKAAARPKAKVAVRKIRKKRPRVASRPPIAHTGYPVTPAVRNGNEPFTGFFQD